MCHREVEVYRSNHDKRILSHQLRRSFFFFLFFFQKKKKNPGSQRAPICEKREFENGKNIYIKKRIEEKGRILGGGCRG